MLSKRKLIALVKGGHVNGWDDPRLPTLSGVRRRGVPPEAVKLFVQRTGVSKADNNIDMQVLEDATREILDPVVPRAFAVLRPLKVTLTDWPAGEVETFEVPTHPKRPELGTRQLPFDGSLYIERDDFEEEPPPKYFRLKPGGEVRLRFGYVIKCQEVIKDADGNVVELKCTHEPTSKSGAKAPSELAGNGKIKGIIHWLSAAAAVPASVRLYDRLFSEAQPGASHDDGDFLRDLNPHSLEDLADAYVEPGVAGAAAGDSFQFERMGYFRADEDTADGRLVFNRIVTLRDTWAKVQAPAPKKGKPKPKKAKAKKEQKPLSPAAAAQAAEVRRLKEEEGLGNSDPRVEAAVAELLRLKAEDA